MAEIEGLRVLVVEDSPVVEMALCDMLQDLGCVLIGPPPNMATALDSIEKAQFDVAIIDLNIRGTKSFSLLRALDEKGIPFLISSRYADWTMPEDWLSRPRLSKSFSATLLKKKLSQVFNQGSTESRKSPSE